MEKILKYHKTNEKTDFEKIREQYKKDFREYVQKREQNEKILFFDTRKQM